MTSGFAILVHILQLIMHYVPLFLKTAQVLLSRNSSTLGIHRRKSISASAVLTFLEIICTSQRYLPNFQCSWFSHSSIMMIHIFQIILKYGTKNECTKHDSNMMILLPISGFWLFFPHYYLSLLTTLHFLIYLMTTPESTRSI